MASVDIADVKKNQLGKLNKFFEQNSFVGGPVVSKQDIEVFKALSNDFDQKNIHVARWYNYVRVLTPQQIAQLPAEGAVVLTSSSSSASSSSSGSSSGSSSSSSSSSSSEDEATKKRKAKEARQAQKILVEQSNLVFDLQTSTPDADVAAIVEVVRAIERPSLIWAQGHEVIEIGYGIVKIRIGCVITNSQVDTDDLLGELEEIENIREVRLLLSKRSKGVFTVYSCMWSSLFPAQFTSPSHPLAIILSYWLLDLELLWQL
jgi:translation elongation factor EF-1beta